MVNCIRPAASTDSRLHILSDAPATGLSWLPDSLFALVRQRDQQDAIIIRVHKHSQTKFRVNCNGVRTKHKR